MPNLPDVTSDDRLTSAATRLRLFFVRHGESEANILGEFSNRGRRRLTARGQAEVEMLAARPDEYAIRKVFCSPMLRASQSAGPGVRPSEARPIVSVAGTGAGAAMMAG
jgi:broad specificity phosphatase PhoE